MILKISVKFLQVLVAPVASLSWVDGQGSFIPPNAVPGGSVPFFKGIYKISN